MPEALSYSRDRGAERLHRFANGHMGRTYIRNLDDVACKGLILQVECRCGRVSWIGAPELIGRRLAGEKVTGSHGWEEVAPILRCRACSARRPKVRAVYPREAGVPAGVPVIPYLRADDRERKRLVVEHQQVVHWLTEPADGRHGL